MSRRSQPVDAWETRFLGLIAVSLMVFGVAAIYSASGIWAVQHDYLGSHFAMRQFIGGVLGVVILLIASRVDYHLWQQLAWSLMGLAAVMLIILLLPFTHAIAPVYNGARRWIELPGIRFQPSEFAKFAIIVWTAMLAAKKGETLRNFRRGLLPLMVVLVPVTALILFEPDLSTASLVVLLAATVVFAAGARIGHFILLGLVALPILWHEIASVQYRLQRMLCFLSPGEELEQASWQVEQSLIGIGAGGLLGVGFGEGFQKLGYLPYAYSDFIFSTIGEEWGFVGVVGVLLLYATFVTIGIRIARGAPDQFGMLVATGLTAMIGLTALMHIAVTLALLPATGLSLPFISFGRSNLLISLFAVGVIINIGQNRSQRKRARR